MGKMIHKELCKRRKFCYANKLYIQKPESVQKNETEKILSDFEIRTGHQIPARRKELVN